MLQKGVCSYEYLNNWEKVNETSFPEKEDFESHLNMEDITDPDYTHAKRVCKGFEPNKLVKYHDFYVQTNTLLLADVLNNFWNSCLEIYELNPAYFFLH